MSADRYNPCSFDWYAKLLAWAESSCWCCSATRALLVGGYVGIVLGAAWGGAYLKATLWALLAGPVVAGALIAARRIWPDDDGTPGRSA